jgi:hypothetical protein
VTDGWSISHRIIAKDKVKKFYRGFKNGFMRVDIIIGEWLELFFVIILEKILIIKDILIFRYNDFIKN